jgi:CheY-like chemotaxis protein
MEGKKVLIVDYDSRSLETMSRLLKSQKLRIIQAADGQAAYDKFKSDKPDLVILEAILPKMHGFDLTKKIFQESEGRVPVIIVTGLYRGPAEKFVSSVMQLLRDEEDIEEDLPDSDSIIAGLSQRIKAKPQRSKEKKPPERTDHE